MSPRALLLCACALAALATPLPGDEIRLADGRVIDGEIVSAPGAETMSIRTRDGGMTAVIHIPATQVVQVRYGTSPRQKALADLDARRAALAKAGGTADAWWTLALDAKGLGQNSLAKDLAQEAIVRDPDHAAARALLGFERVGERWLKGAEAALARGEVLFRGRWVTPAARDAVLADEARAADEAATRRERRLADLEVAKREAEVAAARREALEPPAASAYFGTVTATPSILLRQPGVWLVPGGCPAPVVQPAQPVLELQAQGQGNGYGWKLDYRR